MKGSGEERSGESGEQSEGGEAQEHAGDGSCELPARARRNRQVLRAIGRPRVSRRAPFGRERDGDRSEHEESEEDLKGQGQSVGFVASEDAGEQRTSCETADVGDRPDDPGPASWAAARLGVEIGDECGRRGDRGANRHACEHARDEQPGE